MAVTLTKVVREFFHHWQKFGWLHCAGTRGLQSAHALCSSIPGAFSSFKSDYIAGEIREGRAIIIYLRVEFKEKDNGISLGRGLGPGASGREIWSKYKVKVIPILYY